MIDFPLVMTVLNGERYLVSMLGENTNWVRNVRADGGKARLRDGISEDIFLKEVDVAKRAPILKAFLQHAPGARPHIPLGKDAPFPSLKKFLPVTRFLEWVQQGSIGRNNILEFHKQLLHFLHRGVRIRVIKTGELSFKEYPFTRTGVWEPGQTGKEVCP